MPELRAKWVEIQTFTDRNGPELNDVSSEHLPDGRYVPAAHVTRLHEAANALLAALEADEDVSHEAETLRELVGRDG